MPSAEIKTLTFVTADGNVTFNLNDTSARSLIAALLTLVNGKQDTLVSGENIKTINGTSLLGSGNITISGSSGGEANVIETVKVNGTALVPDSNKAVDVIVPTKTSDLTNDSGFVTSSDVSERLLSKQDTITGGATTIASDNLTAGRALVSNSNGKVAVSAVTSRELGYLDGVTSSIQTQLNAKASSSALATVATSGSYNDLTNKPTIPSAYTLPQATGSSLGGIKANNKSNADTIPCNIDPNTGLLYVQPSSNMEYTYSSPSPVTVSDGSGQSASFSSIRQYKRFLASVSAFSLIINNSLAGENMILIENTGSSDCVVTISDLLYQNVSVDIAYVPTSISIEAGESIVLEYETFNEYTTTIGIVTMSSPISNTSNS